MKFSVISQAGDKLQPALKLSDERTQQESIAVTVLKYLQKMGEAM